MSHATVMIKVTAERLAAHGGDLNKSIGEMMAPFCEQTEDPRFRVFKDENNKYREEYATGTRTMVRAPDGALLSPCDERFRVPGTIGIGSDTHKVLPGYEEIEVPFREQYLSFEAFAKDWHGADSGPDGRFGYYHNPNAKWDWWVIGGRWTGFFPLKSHARPRLGESGAFGNKPKGGRGDVVRLADIDMDAVARETREAAESFWSDWQSWLAGTFVEKNPFCGPRSRALDIGLLRVERGFAASDHTQKAIPWADQGRPGDSRKDWHDVAKLISRDAFMADYIDCFCPIKTYAALDNDGWHAPGRMGWFGSSDDTPETYVKFAREFVQRFVKNAAPDDLLVVVDYHI